MGTQAGMLNLPENDPSLVQMKSRMGEYRRGMPEAGTVSQFVDSFGSFMTPWIPLFYTFFSASAFS